MADVRIGNVVMARSPGALSIDGYQLVTSAFREGEYLRIVGGKIVTSPCDGGGVGCIIHVAMAADILPASLPSSPQSLSIVLEETQIPVS